MYKLALDLLGIRPAIYLNGNTVVNSGAGSEADSYKLDVRNLGMDYKDVSFKLDKSGDYIVLTKFPGMAVDMNNGFEIEMDIKPKFGTALPTFGKKIGLVGTYSDGEGTFKVSITGGVSDTGLIKGSCKYVTGVNDRNNIKIVYDGSSTTFDIYVNGVAQTITYTSQDPFDQYANTDFTENFLLGADHVFGTPPRLATEMDISNLKITANGKVYGDYHFDESVGDRVYDHSGMGNHGEITGGTWTGENLTSTVKTVKTEQVEIGSYMEHGKYHDTPIKWRIINKDENGLMLVTDKVISVKSYDANGDDTEGRTDADRTSYGSSYWETSNLREWLNSNNETVAFSHQAPDSAHIITGENAYDLEKGFLTNFSALENTVISSSKHKSILSDSDQTEKYGGTATLINNTAVADAVTNYDDANYEIVDEKVTLLSVKEVVEYIYKNDMLSDGATYYKAQKEPYLDSNYNTAAEDATHYWLRTPRGSFSRYTRSVYSDDGTIGIHSPYYASMGLRPVIYIKYGQDISGAGTKIDPYKIVKSNIGEYVEMGTYNGKPIMWRVIKNDGQVKLLSDKIISMKPFDAKGDAEGDDRLNAGSNNWETSNIREWLNSSDNSVTYSKNPPNDLNVFDGVNNYETEKGFLTNFNQNELNAINKVTHKALLTGQDTAMADGGNQLHISNQMINDLEENYNDAYFKYIEDTMYLLSAKEVYDDLYLNTAVLGTGYFKAYPTQEAIDNSEDKNSMYIDSYWHYWLRTPYSYNSNYVRKVSTNDTSNGSTDAYRGNRGVRPAFNLKTDVNLVGSGTLVDPYKIAAEKTGEMRVDDYILYTDAIVYKVTATDGAVVSLESTVDASTRNITGSEMVSGVGTLASPYVVITKIKPVITVVKPVNNSIFKNDLDIALNIEYPKAGENLDVYYRIDTGLDIKEETIVSTGGLIEYTKTISVPLPEGNYTIYFWIQDSAGNKSTIVAKDIEKEVDAVTISSVNVTGNFDTIKIRPVISKPANANKYKYEYNIDSAGSLVVDWSSADEIIIENLKANKTYNVDYTVSVIDFIGNTAVRSGTVAVSTLAKNPASVEVIATDGFDMTVSIVNSRINYTNPEHKVVLVDNSDSSEIISDFSANTRLNLTGFTPGNTYTLKTITKSTIGALTENAEVIWTDNVTFITEDVKPEINELAINYGDYKTFNRKVDLKLLATDNITTFNDLNVQFYVKTFEKNVATGAWEETGNNNSYKYYGFDSELGVWKEDIWGDYQKYYSGFDLGSTFGKKVVYVRVADTIFNTSEENAEIIYITEDIATPVIIPEKDKDGTSDNLDTNSGKYKESEGYYLTSDNVVELKVNTKNAAFVQYSIDGVSWSPWERVINGKIDRRITLFGADGLKTVYTRTKSDYEVVGGDELVYYMLDKTPPKVVVATQNNAYIAVDGDLGLVVEMEDDVSKKLYYEIYVEDKNGVLQVIGGDADSGKRFIGSTVDGSITASITGLPTGFLNVIVIIKDELGNVNKKALNIWSK